jgi:predicted O-methyltransferase YrrM
MNLHELAVAQRDMVPHLATLSRYASEASTVIELGVRAGVSTWALLDGLPDSGHLWSVDIDECAVASRVAADPRWTFIRGDDRKADVRERLPRAADLVFIDTSHEYWHTLDELRYARSLGARRIVCHDAEWPGVSRAIRRFRIRRRWRVESYDPARDERGPFGLVSLVPQ